MTRITEQSQPDFYTDPNNIKKLVARALSAGRLRLVIGAGVSQGCGLPSWKELVLDIARSHGLDLPGDDLVENSEFLLRIGAGRDRDKFARFVQDSLYREYENSMKSLSSIELIRALGAMAMAGLRGGVSEIVTFNFDDLLETYLQYHGFLISSVAKLPSLSVRCDAEILHLHGLLPSDTSKPIPSNIVFTESDFDSVVGDDSAYWRQRVMHIFRSNLCLFIGLSGDDPNLRSMLVKAGKEHPVLETDCYWGFRFNSDENDRRRGTFEDNKVLQITIPNEEIASWLLEITQLAVKNTQRV